MIICLFPYLLLLSLFSHSLSYVRLFATPWTVAGQAPLYVGFPRQEYWNGLLFPTPGDLPDPGIKSASPALTIRFFTAEPPGKPCFLILNKILISLNSGSKMNY